MTYIYVCIVIMTVSWQQSVRYGYIVLYEEKSLFTLLNPVSYEGKPFIIQDIGSQSKSNEVVLV